MIPFLFSFYLNNILILLWKFHFWWQKIYLTKANVLNPYVFITILLNDLQHLKLMLRLKSKTIIRCSKFKKKKKLKLRFLLPSYTSSNASMYHPKKKKKDGMCSRPAFTSWMLAEPQYFNFVIRKDKECNDRITTKFSLKIKNLFTFDQSGTNMYSLQVYYQISPYRL